MTAALKKNERTFGTQDGTSLADEFRQLAERYSEIGAKEGVKVVPFLAPDMPLFQKATPEQRISATDFLRIIVSIHEETLASGDSALNSRQLVWRAISRFNLTPSADIFNRFTDDDIILIYNEEQLLLFWNLQFFKYSSLTVEQLFLDTWYRFTKRDPVIHEQLVQMVTDVLSGKLVGTFDLNIPGHEVEEVGTLENMRTWMNINWGSVLSRKGAFGGMMIVQRMKVLS